MEEQESDITLLLEYLHLEYGEEAGEEAGEEDALKASDLVYVGEYVIDGILVNIGRIRPLVSLCGRR